MKYVMLIYHGSAPLPHSDGWDALSDDEQKQIYADYAAVNKTPGSRLGWRSGCPRTPPPFGSRVARRSQPTARSWE